MTKQYTFIAQGSARNEAQHGEARVLANANAATSASTAALAATVATAGANASTASSAIAPGEKAAVAFSLTSLVADLQSSPAERPRMLIMVQAKEARQLVPLLESAGAHTIAPAIGDHRTDASAKLPSEVAALPGPRASALFANAHAVLNCARACAAQAIVLCSASRSLAGDEVFLTCAHRAGLRVFAFMNPDTPALGVVECAIPEAAASSAVPNPQWRTCHQCKFTFTAQQFAHEGHRCPSCRTLTRMSSHERLALVADAGSFAEWDNELPDANPLDFEGYSAKLAAQREKTGLHEAVRTGQCTIDGLPVAVGVMEPDFFMGSMGSVVGEKVARLFDYATELRLPVVLFCASGGARMQEGLASLMQMAKTSCAVQRHDAAGLLYVSVLTDPTTGGVTASFATLGDIILAEPGALIGFAGQRVIRDTIKQELPKGFQTAEFALEHGLIDAIVERGELRNTLANIVALHTPSIDPKHAARLANAPRNRVTVSEQARHNERALGLASKIPFVRNLIRPQSPESQLERHAAKTLRRQGITNSPAPGSAWESVQLARNVHRPTAVRYLEALAGGFLELHGDRAFADDAAIMAGIGWIDGKPATIIAQEKGATLPDRIKRNFGCPQPEGYRKSLRLMRQAEKFGRPIVCLVDTQGAFCGTEAEERGQGNAIAENLAAMAGMHVPIVSVLLGEGGSGGALALAVANRVAMQEHAVYSILSPEGFASILWKDRSRAPEAAAAMRMNASDVLSMGVVDEVIAEGPEPAHINPDTAIENMREYLTRTLRELSAQSPEELRSSRQARFARF